MRSMKDFYISIKKIFLTLINKDFIRFAIVGCIGVGFNYSIFYILYRFININYIASSAIGYISAIFLAFFLNRHFTFNHRDEGVNHVISMAKYFVVNLFSLTCGLFFLRFLVEILGIIPEISAILNVSLTAVLNFLGSKFLVFRRKTHD